MPRDEPVTSATFPESSTRSPIYLLRQRASHFRREVLHCRWSRTLAEGGEACLRHLVVLIHRASAHPYRAGHLAIARQRDAAGEDDDPAAVRGVDAEKGLTWLGHLTDLSCGETSPGRGESLVYAMSMLATQAPSMRWKVTRFLPASITAMFIGRPISCALCSAAETISLASSSVITR